MKSHEVGILLPTYREAENIERLIREIERLNVDASILVVDDSSPDGTSNIVKELQKEFDNIELIVRLGKFGLGTAITDGFRYFVSLKNPPKQIITMDSDYSHNPKEIEKLTKTKYDLAIGSRYCDGGSIKNWSIMRLTISKIANLFTRVRIKADLSDYTSGMRCYSLKLVSAIVGSLHSETYEIQIETIRQAKVNGFDVGEVPISFVNRTVGKSKLSFTEVKDFLSYTLIPSKVRILKEESHGKAFTFMIGGGYGHSELKQPCFLVCEMMNEVTRSK